VQRKSKSEAEVLFGGLVGFRPPAGLAGSLMAPLVSNAVEVGGLVVPASDKLCPPLRAPLWRASALSADGRTVVAVDDAQPSLFLIDAADGRLTEEVRLEGVPKAAQIARYAPDNSLLGVTSLNSDTVSLIDPSFRQQTAIKVGSQPMDMAFRGDELFVACQGDGSVHVIDIPKRRAMHSFRAGVGCESIGFF
jgi:YVTN family beta-propeller protein